MRKILAEALIITLETGLVLAIVAALGVPGGKSPKATAVRGCEKTCKKTKKIEDSDNLRAAGNAIILWPNKSP